MRIDKFSIIHFSNWFDLSISLGIHLSIAKSIGFRSLSYITIRNDLKKLNILAEHILHDLRVKPVGWIDQVRENKYRLIESFYLSLADREKVYSLICIFIKKISPLVGFPRCFFFTRLIRA